MHAPRVCHQQQSYVVSVTEFLHVGVIEVLPILTPACYELSIIVPPITDRARLHTRQSLPPRWRYGLSSNWSYRFADLQGSSGRNRLHESLIILRVGGNLAQPRTFGGFSTMTWLKGKIKQVGQGHADCASLLKSIKRSRILVQCNPLFFIIWLELSGSLQNYLYQQNAAYTGEQVIIEITASSNV